MSPAVKAAELKKVRLQSGGHHKPKKGTPVTEVEACVMEMVAYVADEPWSDHPKCASKVITAFCIRWNDAMNDKDRQILVPYIPRLVGTAASGEIEGRRAFMAADWCSRTSVPRWLRALGLEEEAAPLEALAPVVDIETARAARDALREARRLIDAKRSQRRAELQAAAGAAWDAWAAGAAGAAWDAWAAGAAWAAWAAGAAGDAWAAGAAGAAWAAWAAGAAGAAWAAWAAWAAVSAEYLSRAKGKSYEEQRAIAYELTKKHFDEVLLPKLQPIVKELQQSALDLLDRMIAAK